MPGRGISPTRLCFVAAATCAALFLFALVASPPSEAAYPGKPGKIAYKGFTGGSLEIFLVSPFASGGGALTHGDFASAGDPSWSRNGKRIVFRVAPGGTGTPGEIFVVNRNGSGQDQLTFDGATYDDQEPNFFPNGKRILFESNRGGAGYDLYAMNANGTGVAPLAVTDGVGEHEPAISPDGRRIAYVRADDGDADVWLMNANGSDQHPLIDTDGGMQETEPNFSPDGRRIAFTTSPGFGPGEVWVAAANGSGAHPVTSNGEENDTPAFSPNGKRLTFDSTALSPMTGRDRIVTMAVEGGPLKALTPEGTDSVTPDWGPIPVRCQRKLSTLVGTPKKDRLVGTPGPDVIAGLGGNDVVIGKGGGDRLCGGAGRDRLLGGGGRDRINGGGGRDRLKGGGGRDRCFGAGGRDLAAGCEFRGAI
jgi:Ca2+-binding RTX toxin-like protein